MKKLQMVDLIGQYKEIKEEINKEISEVLETAYFIKGPNVAKFENNLADYLGIKKVIGCANGTDALQVALMSLDLPKGSEILVPDFTFVATSEVVELLGFKAVLVDVYEDSFNININKLEKSITDKTKAIIPVHIFGQCADMENIMKIAKKYKLFVIEDTAQAIGAEYKFSDGSIKKAGTIGDIGCTSFFPSKNLGAFGDGGAIFTNNDDLIEKISTIVNHGQGERYRYVRVGVNSRLDALQAVVLNIKLKHLDEYNSARQEVANYYNKSFSNNTNLITPVVSEFTNHIYHQYTLKVLNDKRDGLVQYLSEHGIPSKVFYPKPLHEEKPYAQEGDFQTTEKLSQIVISLPIHTELEEEQLEFITKTVNNFFE